MRPNNPDLSLVLPLDPDFDGPNSLASPPVNARRLLKPLPRGIDDFPAAKEQQARTEDLVAWMRRTVGVRMSTLGKEGGRMCESFVEDDEGIGIEERRDLGGTLTGGVVG